LSSLSGRPNQILIRHKSWGASVW